MSPPQGSESTTASTSTACPLDLHSIGENTVTDAQNELAELTERLNRLISTAPRGSRTAQRAADQLADFADPKTPLTDAQKIAGLRGTIADFRDGLRFADRTRHAPGCGPESAPLRPYKKAGGG